jgi:hypothetical protein
VGIIVLFLFVSRFLPAQTPDRLKSFLPSVAGWELSDDIEVFNPDNLFDRINGAAPLFLANNFREMTSMEYKKGSDYITIQAYRHATPDDAFGMYASERSSELTTLSSIGGEAQGDATNLFFFAGSIYVKMWSNSSSDNVGATLQIIAKGLADGIDPQADYPSIFRAFPAEGKIPYSESYTTSGYIGHEFLSSVYAVGYEEAAEGRKFQLFVIAGTTSEEAGNILAQYSAFTKQTLEANEEGVIVIKDRYNGDIPFLRRGRYLAGIFSENSESVPGADRLLEKLIDRLTAILRAE